jgi:hypothetical protein
VAGPIGPSIVNWIAVLVANALAGKKYVEIKIRTLTKYILVINAI